MSREIKFRTWDGKRMWLVGTLRMAVDPSFMAVYGLSPTAVFDCMDNDGNIFRGSSPESPVMQYTGLKDKNGQEIYEGDIVAPTTWPDAYWLVHSWEENLSDLTAIKQGIMQVEVIGNIYESPELLDAHRTGGDNMAA